MSYHVHNLQQGRWVEIQAPDEVDIEFLRKEFPDFHPTNLEDSTQRVEHAKLDLTEKYLFMSVTVPFSFAYGQRAKNFELSMFLTDDAIVTITPEPTNILKQERSEQDEIAGSALPETPPVLTYRFFELLYDFSKRTLDNIEKAISRIDQQILDVGTSGIIRDIAILQRNMIYFMTTLETSIPLFHELESKNVSFGTSSMKEYWGDILDKLRQQKDKLEDQDKVLAKLAKAHENYLTHHTTHVINTLTVFSVILLPLNLIASIFGMNFATIPGSNHNVGFYLTIIGMGVVGAIMYVFFRYKNYL